MVKPSVIHGNGLFADMVLEPQQPIFLAIGLDQIITPIGRHINHSNQGNTYMLFNNVLGWIIYAKHRIPANEEITIDYRCAPEFISTPHPEWT